MYAVAAVLRTLASLSCMLALVARACAGGFLHSLPIGCRARRVCRDSGILRRIPSRWRLDDFRVRCGAGALLSDAGPIPRVQG